MQNMRVDFQFDKAAFAFNALPFKIPYPVPFKLLGDETKVLTAGVLVNVPFHACNMSHFTQCCTTAMHASLKIWQLSKEVHVDVLANTVAGMV